MNMLIEELQSLAADPRSWIVVLFMFVAAAFSVFTLFRCPHVRGTDNPSGEDVEKARNHPTSAGWRFGLMMLLGASLTVAGLFMIAGGIKPTLALAAMVLGVVIIQTEPPRLLIRENRRVVIASRDADTMTLEMARDRLRGSHTQLAVTNVILLVGLVAALMAF